MATTSRRRAAGRKSARRYHAARPRKVVMKGGFELIPTGVMKQLSELGLPADKRAYTERLRKLLEAAG
jgi:hypothetical protein